jgi:hypothetical protein
MELFSISLVQSSQANQRRSFCIVTVVSTDMPGPRSNENFYRDPLNDFDEIPGFSGGNRAKFEPVPRWKLSKWACSVGFGKAST